MIINYIKIILLLFPTMSFISIYLCNKNNNKSINKSTKPLPFCSAFHRTCVAGRSSESPPLVQCSRPVNSLNRMAPETHIY